MIAHRLALVIMVLLTAQARAQPAQKTPIAPPPGLIAPQNSGALPNYAPSTESPPESAAPPSRKMEDFTTPLDMIQRAWDDPVPAPGQISPGIKKVKYDPLRTIRIRTRQLAPTIIALPSCEAIAADSISYVDRKSFDIQPIRPNEVRISARYAGADIAVQISGASGRSYVFYVRSEPVKTDVITDFRVIVEDQACGNSDADHAQGADFLRSVAFDRAKLKWDQFEIFARTPADAELAPEAVGTDGVFVYLDYGQRIFHTRFPVAYLTIDGIDTPVNQRVVGALNQILVVEAVGNITLKNNERALCLRFRRQDSPSPAIHIESDTRTTSTWWPF